MTVPAWDVTVWRNVRSGPRVEVRFLGWHRELAPEFIEDQDARAFEMALGGIPDAAMFTFGGRRTLAEAMFAYYREHGGAV